MDVLEILLNSDKPKLPEKQIKIRRLSEEFKKDVVFDIKALTYNKVTELKAQHVGENLDVHILLAGVTSPNLKSEELKNKYNAVTPAEMIKNMLLPGEIEDISKEVEKLSGYRVATVEEIKKK